MVELSWCELPADVVEGDRALLRDLDGVLARAVELAGRHLACRPGCTACCLGPFEITVLDAARLLRGVTKLLAERPDLGAKVVAAASRQWELVSQRFPGDTETGILCDDEKAREELLGRFASLPCPLLDEAGRCVLYAHRPLSCRSYGPPLRLEETRLEPCELGFTTATPQEVEAARVELDPCDREGALLRALAGTGRDGADTVVCAVLASVRVA